MPLLFLFLSYLQDFSQYLLAVKRVENFVKENCSVYFVHKNTSLENIINNDIYWLRRDRRLSGFQYFPKLCVDPAVCHFWKSFPKGKKKSLIQHLSSSFDFQFPVSALLYFKCKHQLYFNKTLLFAILFFWYINDVVYLSIYISYTLLVTLLSLFTAGFLLCFSSYLQVLQPHLQYKPLTWKSSLMCDLFLWAYFRVGLETSYPSLGSFPECKADREKCFW